MKKFICAIMSLTMLATTFVSSAFAADTLDISMKADKEEYVIGESVAITVTASGMAFADFGAILDYDKAAFDCVSVVDDGTFKGSAVAGKGEPTFIVAGGTAMSDESAHNVTMTFTAKTAGTYKFAFNEIDTYACDKNGDDLNCNIAAPISVVVKDATPAKELKAEFDTAAASKFTYDDVYNYGVGGTVTVPEGKSATGVTFDISNGTQIKNYDFDFGTSIAADTSFGLNIYRVPVGVELSFSNLQVK